MTFLAAVGADIDAGEFAARAAGSEEKTTKATSSTGKKMSRVAETSQMVPRLCRLSKIHGKQKQQCLPNSSENACIF
jgi:hypothetical protein